MNTCQVINLRRKWRCKRTKRRAVITVLAKQTVSPDRKDQALAILSRPEMICVHCYNAHVNGEALRPSFLLGTFREGCRCISIVGSKKAPSSGYHDQPCLGNLTILPWTQMGSWDIAVAAQAPGHQPCEPSKSLTWIEEGQAACAYSTSLIFGIEECYSRGTSYSSESSILRGSFLIKIPFTFSAPTRSIFVGDRKRTELIFFLLREEICISSSWSCLAMSRSFTGSQLHVRMGTIFFSGG